MWRIVKCGSGGELDEHGENVGESDLVIQLGRRSSVPGRRSCAWLVAGGGWVCGETALWFSRNFRLLQQPSRGCYFSSFPDSQL